MKRLETDLKTSQETLVLERKALREVRKRNDALDALVRGFGEDRTDEESITWGAVVIPDAERERMHTLLKGEARPRSIP